MPADVVKADSSFSIQSLKNDRMGSSSSSLVESKYKLEDDRPRNADKYSKFRRGKREETVRDIRARITPFVRRRRNSSGRRKARERNGVKSRPGNKARSNTRKSDHPKPRPRNLMSAGRDAIMSAKIGPEDRIKPSELMQPESNGTDLYSLQSRNDSNTSFCRSFSSYDLTICSSSDGRKVVLLEFGDKSFINGQPIKFSPDGRVLTKLGHFDPTLQRLYNDAILFKQKRASEERRSVHIPPGNDIKQWRCRQESIVSDESIGVDDAESVFRFLSDRIEELTTRNHKPSATSDHSGTMNSCRVFNHAPDDSELRIVELTRQLEEADLYNKKLETIFYDVEEARVNSQIRAENLEREKGHLEISLREANQENERLRGKLQTVSSSLSDLRESSTKEMLISRDENAILIEEKGRLEERVMKLMKSMKLKEDNYKQKDSYIKDLENITDTLGKELECFQRQVKNLRSILEKQNKEKHFLREELSKTELLKQNYRSLEKKNRQLEQDNQIMKSLLKAADDKLISMETMQINKETKDEELKEGFSKTITELADVYNNWSDDTIQIPNLTRTEQ